MPDATQSARVQGCIVDCLECYSLCKQQATDRLMEDCAEICRTAADFMLRGSVYHAEVCAVCARICEACAQSCEEAGGMDECARACRGCAQSCRGVRPSTSREAGQ
jgi:hypothetical protein